MSRRGRRLWVTSRSELSQRSPIGCCQCSQLSHQLRTLHSTSDVRSARLNRLFVWTYRVWQAGELHGRGRAKVAASAKGEIELPFGQRLSRRSIAVTWLKRRCRRSTPPCVLHRDLLQRGLSNLAALVNGSRNLSLATPLARAVSLMREGSDDAIDVINQKESNA